MKTTLPLLLIIFITGCAHEFAEQPAIHEIECHPAIQTTAYGAVELAQKNYSNGLASEAFTGLLRAYDESHNLKYIEFAAELADREIGWMQAQDDEKSEYLSDTQEDIDDFYSFIKSDQLGIGDSAYDTLRSDGVESFSKEDFIPRTDQTKNAMLKVQGIVSSEIANSNDGQYNRLLKLAKKIKWQRESICKLRTQYISDVFIGPRVALGDKLVYLAKYDRPNIWGHDFYLGDLNSYWIDKLELLFPRDYGTWIAQSDEVTRMAFKTLVGSIKNALGEKKYEDFKATIDLLSNNKQGGIDAWWPSETSK
jgi:hypothetical protein